MNNAGTPLRFEDVAVGDELPALTLGPITTSHLMRWSAAIENWHRIHYDERFATEHDGLPGLLINGTWKQHFLVSMVRAWAEPAGWLARIEMSFRGMDLVGDTLTASGTVRECARDGEFGRVTCEVGIHNEREQRTTTPGSAVVVLGLRDGPPVPYPFPGLSG